MKTLKGEIIQHALTHSKRVYLCGQLAQSQEFEHINNDGLEIGVSYYQTFTSDAPHFHASNNEYNIVLQGELKAYLYHEHKEYIFREGDLFLIEPNMPYVVKAQAGTKVMFVKSPGGNDKKTVPIDAPTEHWMDAWDNTMN